MAREENRDSNAFEEGGVFTRRADDAVSLSAKSPEQCESVPALPSSSPGAELPNLDLLAKLDEPEQLILALKAYVAKRTGMGWRLIYRGLNRISAEFDELNKPAPR